jgi:hypothetical protein
MKLKPKQKATISNWLSPESETYGNLYQSAIKAGFRSSYALNLSHLRPSWLSETMTNSQLEPQHIIQGVQQLAMAAPNSKSPDDTRLKAYETLAKITGMMNTQPTTIINNVQPILNGESMKNRPVQVESTHTVKDSANTPENSSTDSPDTPHVVSPLIPEDD